MTTLALFIGEVTAKGVAGIFIARSRCGCIDEGTHRQICKTVTLSTP